MLILSIKTDQPTAEFGLFEGQTKLDYMTYEAHRTLAGSIHLKIKTMLNKASRDWPDIGGVAVHKGPGSFTGLRIGLSVANALAYSQKIPIIGDTGEDWLEKALTQLLAGQNQVMIMPEYGSPPHITLAKK